MRKFYIYLLGLFTSILLFSCSSTPSLEGFKNISLNDNWEFKSIDDSIWLEAQVPGTVHTDLLNNKIIKDPFYRLNEHSLQWIDKKDWEYITTFNISPTDVQFQNIELEFLGLDTYSEVYINDQLLLETDNMFRTYKSDIQKLVKEGNNTLRILFKSPINEGIKKHDALGFKIPVSDNDLANIGKVEGEKQVSIFTRKAGYHFGWDWGPRLVTSGIWRPIHLKLWNSHKVEDLNIVQNSLNDDKAELTAHLEIDASVASQTTTIDILVDGKSFKTLTSSLKKGINNVSIPFSISNPEKWWPNGYGNQKLYNITVKVTANKLTNEKSHRIGLRTIELVTDTDSIGNTFYFKVNGSPIFMKGANYIPQDVFLTQVKQDNYEHIINSAIEANMNMLRVWGGGIYENDAFYDLCDEKGILVWQDFMFACAMFPGDESFLKSIEQEAIDNVKRLRNHTSIALWCGNNEILSAWENWGWKNNVKEEQSEEIANTIWKAYDNIFHKVLPKVVSVLDGNRSYWPSSPESAFGEKESFDRGDAHYWMVWWGKEPFDNYNKAIPRFMSEFGFQSFPNMATINQYATPEDYDIFSDVMKSHQRSSIGNGTIDEYMSRHYQKPKDFEHFIYTSQLLQAHGIKVGIEAHRRNRDRCMGTLYWQINDCWPVASWSSIDYYGNWKALHYSVKNALSTYLISFENENNKLKTYIISDSLQDLEASLRLQLIDFDGNILREWNEDVNVIANSVNQYYEVEIDNKTTVSTLLKATLLTNGKEITNNIHYFSPFKELPLPDPGIHFKTKESETEFIVIISTQKLAKNVYVTANLNGNFSDNYFDLLPGESKSISIQKADIEDISQFKKALKVITLKDTYSE